MRENHTKAEYQGLIGDQLEGWLMQWMGREARVLPGALLRASISFPSPTPTPRSQRALGNLLPSGNQGALGAGR